MKRLKQKINLYWAPVVAVIVMPGVAWGCDPGAGKLCNPLRGEMGLWDLVEFLVRDILVEIIAPIVITLMLLWSGFLFITAQGNEGKLETARRNFFYVVLGAIILLGAYLILEVVLNTVGEITA